MLKSSPYIIVIISFYDKIIRDNGTKLTKLCRRYYRNNLSVFFYGPQCIMTEVKFWALTVAVSYNLRINKSINHIYLPKQNLNRLVNASTARNSAIGDKPRDAFKGQSRSPNMVQFHMLALVSC